VSAAAALPRPASRPQQEGKHRGDHALEALRPSHRRPALGRGAVLCLGRCLASCTLAPPGRSSPSTRPPPLWNPAAEPVTGWADSPAPVPEFVFDQPLELVAARTFPLATVEPCIARRARSRFALLAPPAPAHPFIIALQARGAAPRYLRDRFSSPRRLAQALA